MGLADTVTKAYMKENTVFADAFNYLIYGGKAVVNPARLQELDTTEIALPFGAQNENRTQPDDAVQKYRDVLKSAVIKQDGEAAYILLGIENQTDIHYAMPVRNIIYDALQYGKQVADIAAKHRTDGSKGHSRGEYLSGFYKDDKITPVITLVLHFGANEWDGPLSLHEMMAVKNESLLNFVQDYQIHLIDPAKLSKEDLEKFSTSLPRGNRVHQVFQRQKTIDGIFDRQPAYAYGSERGASNQSCNEHTSGHSRGRGGD